MKNSSPIESVQERDIDLLLLEELSISSDFQSWFINQVSNNSFKIFTGAKHSVHEGNLGQSDLEIRFINHKNIKYGLLVENKINAIAMKDQYNRYVKRGGVGIEKKYWDRFIVCMVAPFKYLTTNEEAKSYKHHISYEKIYYWFYSKGDKRSLHKALILKEAIEQNRRGYVCLPNSKVTDFFNKYISYKNKHYPELNSTTKLGPKPLRSSWIYFKPTEGYKKFKIVHKREKGYVDLQISNMGKNINELKVKLHDITGENLNVEKANNSASLRKKVPKLDGTKLFEGQTDSVNKGLLAVKELVEISSLVYNKLFSNS